MKKDTKSKKDGRKQKGQKAGELRQRVKKYKSEQQKRKRAKNQSVRR